MNAEFWLAATLIWLSVLGAYQSLYKRIDRLERQVDLNHITDRDLVRKEHEKAKRTIQDEDQFTRELICAVLSEVREIPAVSSKKKSSTPAEKRAFKQRFAIARAEKEKAQ